MAAARHLEPTVGLDVICTKIAVDFQTMTAATAADTIVANLELLREATRADAAFHVAPRRRGNVIGDVQVARGMLATGNPEQLRGQCLDDAALAAIAAGAAARVRAARYQRASRRPGR